MAGEPKRNGMEPRHTPIQSGTTRHHIPKREPFRVPGN
jgi:hypothetical protein